MQMLSATITRAPGHSRDWRLAAFILVLLGIVGKTSPGLAQMKVF